MTTPPRQRDVFNVSREGRLYVRRLLKHYVNGFINDDDYRRLEIELLDVIRAERMVARRCRGVAHA